MTGPSILLGLGDGVEGRRALDWAAREAQIRRCELRVVRIFHWTSHLAPWESTPDRTILASFRNAATTQLYRAVAHVHEVYPDVKITAEVIDGLAWQELAERSADATLTVLGARQHGALGAAMLGSVSTLVAARGCGAIVVVAAEPGLPEEGPAVVAGIDGERCTDDVLDFAFDYADRHDRPLHAVFCWRPGLVTGTEWAPAAPPPERAERWLAEVVAGRSEKYPDVAVHRRVVRAHAADGLIEEACNQELLVVGAHARHARSAALLGSVSQGVLHHATCPVAVIHDR